jgi:hypothetical protein
MRLPSKTIAGKVYGPYMYKGRRQVTVERDDGSKCSMTYARFLYQEHVGRVLGPEEHVDHIDEDRLNDSIDNFQILTPSANTTKSNGGPAEMVKIICGYCGGETEKRARFVRHNRKQGKAGPFCDKRCSRAWQIQRSRGGGETR